MVPRYDQRLAMSCGIGIFLITSVLDGPGRIPFSFKIYPKYNFSYAKFTFLEFNMKVSFHKMILLRKICLRFYNICVMNLRYFQNWKLNLSQKKNIACVNFLYMYTSMCIFFKMSLNIFIHLCLQMYATH